MFDPIQYHKRLTDAGLPDKQATIMMNMMEDIEKIINFKDEERKDGDNAI